tara:strand:- start:562 stop:858 length:297 start_codon:yes stop_codon:yes gene_type:complete
MAKHKVEITKVFGVAVTKTATIEAETIQEAVEKAKDSDWLPIYNSITPSNLSDSYEFAEIVVDGVSAETMRFNNELLNDAVDMNRDSKNNDSDIKTLS